MSPEDHPPQLLTLSDLADVVYRTAPLPVSNGQRKMAKSELLYIEPDHRVSRDNKSKLDAVAHSMTSAAVTTAVLADSVLKNNLPETAHNVVVSESESAFEKPIEVHTENIKRPTRELTDEVNIAVIETTSVPDTGDGGEIVDRGTESIQHSETQPRPTHSESNAAHVEDGLDSVNIAVIETTSVPDTGDGGETVDRGTESIQHSETQPRPTHSESNAAHVEDGLDSVQDEQPQVNDETTSTPLDEPMSLEDAVTLPTTAAASHADTTLISNSSPTASADIQLTQPNAMESLRDCTDEREDSSMPASEVGKVAVDDADVETPVAKRQRTHYDLNAGTPDAPRSKPMTREQRKYCSAIIRNMKRLKEARPFLVPVDPVKFNIPEYPNIIRRPMDFSTVEKNLGAQQYYSAEEFADDVRLIFENCYRFNGKESVISASAKSLENRFETQMKKLPPLIEIDVNPVFATPAPRHSLGRPKSAQSIPSANNNHTGFSTPSTPAINTRPRRETHLPPHHNLPLTSPSHAYHSINDPQLKFCHQVLREFTKKAHAAYAFAFLQPVDFVTLNIPDYPRIIKRPMDISTIRRKLESGEYASHTEFEADVILMFNNCYTYNAPGTLVHNWGKQLEMVFRNKWRDLPTPAPPKFAKTPRARGSATRGTAKRPRGHDEEEMEFSEESEDEHATQLAELEKHLLVMSQQLATMKSKKAKSDKRRKKASSPTASVPAGPSKTKGTPGQGKRGSVSAGGAKRAPRKRKPKAKGEGGATEGSGRNKKVAGVMHEEEEDFGNHTYTHNAPSSTSATLSRRGSNTITEEEKLELSKLINDLPDSKLATVVEIIRESMPELRDAGEEIELDIDTLSPTTLTKLYRFVSGNVPGAKRGGRGSGRGRGRVRGRGGAIRGGAAGEAKKEKDRKGKMTYLTEEEQSQKINELEMKLKQFAEVNGVAVPVAETGGNGQEGLSSDSSSSGSEDSDSGEESSESLV